MRDLVVAGERRVDGRHAAVHVLQHRERHQVAHEDAHHGAQERIAAAAVAARLHVAPPLARGGDQLEHDLPREQHDGAGDVRAVGQERAVAGVRRPLLGEPADGHQGALGLARQQVAAARSAGDEPDAARVPALELGAVVGVRAADHPRGFLLDPAERGDVLVRAEQDAGLAGAGLRRQVGLPLDQLVTLVREPARHRRRRAVADRAPQHRQRQAVDLEEHDPRHVGLDHRPAAPGDAPGDPQRVLGVVVDARDDRDRRPDRGRDERDEQRVEGAGDVQRLGRDLRRDQQHHRIEGEHEQEPDRDRERQPQRRHDRRQHRVQHGHDRRDDDRVQEPVDVGARDKARGEQQRDGRREPGEQQPQRPQPWPLRAPGERRGALRHRAAAASASLPLKNSSARRVFVCCSPSRSTPCPDRNTRDSAATSNASCGAHLVDSSRIRESSG